MGSARVMVVGLIAAGALGCDTVDIGKPPADVNACRPSQSFFVERIWPEFLGKDYGGRRCSDAQCHGPSSARMLLLPVPTSAPGLPLPSDWAAIYRGASEQMLCTEVVASPLLVRPSSVDHGGGMLIDPNGPEAALLRMWVGAP